MAFRGFGAGGMVPSLRGLLPAGSCDRAARLPLTRR
ncbi:MAG: hypothetical protein H6Q09_1011, partial [Acidobacteria bacterium]|nr:hypothetical protein [Acidobacteriota bacterium]